MMSPCMTCPEKGCGVKHDTCEQYLEYKERSRRYNKQLAEESDLDELLWRDNKPWTHGRSRKK